MIHNESTVEHGHHAECVGVLAQLDAVPDTLRRMIGERTSDDLRQPGHDGGHAAVEVICHLQDWEEIVGERVWRMLNQDSPVLESYDDSLWSIEHDYPLRDALEALEAFAILRANVVSMLAGADGDTWNRTAELEGHGTITLSELMEARTRSDQEHIAELGEALR